MIKKNYFWEINIQVLVNKEREKINNQTPLKKREKKILEEVDVLCKEEKKLVNQINFLNFNKSLLKLIELDAKITSYLFFLIHNDFFDEFYLERLTKKESLSDYYEGLTFGDGLNEYKIISCPIEEIMKNEPN